MLWIAKILSNGRTIQAFPVSCPDPVEALATANRFRTQHGIVRVEPSLQVHGHELTALSGLVELSEQHWNDFCNFMEGNDKVSDDDFDLFIACHGKAEAEISAEVDRYTGVSKDDFPF